MKTSSIVLTAYFNTLPDDQRGVHWKGNDITRIGELYRSVHSLGLTMKVFHDHLTKSFIYKYSKGGISFLSYTPRGDVLNARWNCYYQYIQRTNFDKYLCLDADTELLRNPFPLIEMDRLVIGSELAHIGSFPWINGWFMRAYGEVLYPKLQVLNCGILGGSRKVMLQVLGRYFDELSQAKRKDMVDMAIFNKIVREVEYKTGYPIHTQLGKYEKNECYIRHK